MDKLTYNHIFSNAHEIHNSNGECIADVFTKEKAALFAAGPELKRACERALDHVNHAYKAFPNGELEELRYDLIEALEKANDY